MNKPKDIKISPTKKTPEILANGSTGYVRLAGMLYPDNSYETYNELYQWIIEYFKGRNKNFRMDFRIKGMSDESYHWVMEYLKKLDKYHKDGRDIEVRWYYDADDEDVMEDGEDLEELVSFSFRFMEE